MASGDTEGRREIQAARKRLAAAKLQASSAAKALKSAKETEESTKNIAKTANQMVKMAKKNADAATKTADTATTSRDAVQSQYEDIEKEVTEAEAFLKEAEERCEVVDVDSGDDERLNDIDSDDEPSRKKKKQKTGFTETIVVEGCGVLWANGTYKRSDELYLGVHTYYKEGQWEGKDAKYEIWYLSNTKKWYIWVVGERHGVGAPHYNYLYKAPATTGAFSEGPPENGWKVYDDGVNPAPTLKWS